MRWTCALWDLEAKLRRSLRLADRRLDGAAAFADDVHVWGRRSEKMAAAAVAYKGARAIKLKLTGEANDADRVRAVREAAAGCLDRRRCQPGFHAAVARAAHADADGDQGRTHRTTVPIGQEALLDGFQSPIPVAGGRKRAEPGGRCRAGRSLPGNEHQTG